MNRSKKLYILLGVLAVVCVVTFCVCKYEEKKEQIQNSDEVILEVPAGDVTSLSWETESGSFAFHKDGKWLYDEDEAFPVSEEKLEELLETFQEFGVSFIIEEVEDYGQYGLDHPVCTIQIETEDQEYEIKLGDYSTMDSQRYVSIGDGNVYLVQSDPYSSFDVELADLIEHDEIPDFEEAQAQEIQIAGIEDYQIIYEEEGGKSCCKDDVYFTKENSQPLDTSLVEDYLNTLSSLYPTDYVTYNVSEEELETYGLSDPELTLNVRYVPGEDEEKTEDASEDEEEADETDSDGTRSFTISISRDPEEAEKAAKKAEKDPDAESEEEVTAYARIGDSQIVYQITSEQYRNLMKASYHNLCHQQLVYADVKDIKQVDISLEGEDYTFTCKAKKEDVKWFYEEEELEGEDFQDALTSLSAAEFTDEKPSDKEEISLTISLDNEDFPEVRIELYRYDGSNCLAVVDGESLCLVDRTEVVDLIEAVNGIVLK